MAGNTAKRNIGIEFALRSSGEAAITLDAKICENNLSVSSTIDTDYAEARTDQEPSRLTALSKLGDTIYTLVSLDDSLGNRFVPLSVLTSLRRKVVANLDMALKLNHRYCYRHTENKKTAFPGGNATTYHDNVSNHLSEKFYREHGVNEIEYSAETVKMNKCSEPQVVMTTRYCLRRELGCCKKSDDSNKLPENLYLKNGRIVFKLVFNCKKCEMQILTNSF